MHISLRLLNMGITKRSFQTNLSAEHYPVHGSAVAKMSTAKARKA